jgi:hypothetical protein
MRKLLTVLAVTACSLHCFAQVDLSSLWDEIKTSISNGTFDSGSYDLFGVGLGGLVNDFDMSVLSGGSDKLDFEQGGFLGSLFGDLSGGIFGDDLMSAMGIEEIHNDASLNSNLIWGIVMTKKLTSPEIEKRQRKIMFLQDSINLRVRQLYELELLTVKYMSKKQSDAVDIEEEQSFIKLAQDIEYYFDQCKNLCDESGFSKTKVALTEQVLNRSLKIALKVYDFAKKDGDKNLLHNQDRDEMIAYV